MVTANHRCSISGKRESQTSWDWKWESLPRHYWGLFSKAFYSKVLTDPDSLDDLMFFICL